MAKRRQDVVWRMDRKAVFGAKRGIKAAPPNRRRQLKSHIFIRSIPVLVSLDVDDLHDLRENHVDNHEDNEPEHVA